MYYTLEDFLLDNPTLDIRLLTKVKCFSNVHIEAVSVQELPLDDFIKKNELVLSTAIGCVEQVSLFKELIAGVKAAQASAIILTFKDSNYVVPDEVIAYANEQDLSLFVIPWECRFSEIQASVIQKIQNKKLEIYQNIQTALLNSFFDSQSLDCAAGLVENLLHAPVAIMDRTYKIRGKSIDFLEDTDATVKKFEILINYVLSGYLCVIFPENADLPEERLLEKYVLFPISLWFNRKNIEDMMETRLKNDFVWNLANQNYESFDEIARQGAQLHFDLTRSYTCVMLSAMAGEAPSSVPEYSSETASVASKIEAVILEQGKRQKLQVMLADRSLRFIIYVENSLSNPLSAIQSFLTAIQQQLQNELPVYEFFWGISETSLKPSNFCHLYYNASLALQYCLNSKTKQYQFTYQDTQKARVVSALSNNDEVVSAANETLKPLQKYDTTSGIDLMGTLIKFIACNYNISLTARELHIHRQSLLYRLEKIESLTEMSLSNHKDLFLLESFSRIFLDY